MKSSLGTKGRLALDMIADDGDGSRRTWHWSDEADLASKVRAATSVSPIVTAIFRQQARWSMDARAPTLDFRYQVWRETDDAAADCWSRCCTRLAVIWRYVDWPSDVPMLFVRNGSEYRDAGGQTFRSWLTTGPSLLRREDAANPLALGRPPHDAVPGSARQARAGSPCADVCRSLDDRAPGPRVGILYDASAREAAAELTRSGSSPICCSSRPRWRAMRCARRARGGSPPRARSRPAPRRAERAQGLAEAVRLDELAETSIRSMTSWTPAAPWPARCSSGTSLRQRPASELADGKSHELQESPPT